jgi:hypothetical protein
VTVTATSEGQSGSAAITVTVALPFAVPDLLANASFETGWDGFVDWSNLTPGPSTGAFSVTRSQDVAKDGVWAVKSTFGPNSVDVANQFAYPFANQLNAYARVWFYLSGAIPTTHHKWIRFRPAGFGPVDGGLYLSSAEGGVTWCDVANSGIDVDIGVGVPTFGVWHSIEVQYDRTTWNGPHGPRARFWYDGTVAVGPSPTKWFGSPGTAYWGDDAGTPNPAGPWLYAGAPSSAVDPYGLLIFDDTFNAGNTATGAAYYDRIAVSTQRIGP